MQMAGVRIGVFVLAVATSCFAEAALDRDALWRVVDDLCVPGELSAGVPFPCQSVDLENGIAILGVEAGHFLLIPTDRIEGI